MAVLVGIDEAGYGPLLGPMLVSSAAFEVPDELLKGSMWAAMGKSVSKGKAKLAGRLLVTDSKQAFSKGLGIKHLQRTTLACLANLGHKPANLDELVGVLCGGSAGGRLDEYKWYQGLCGRRLEVDEGDLAIAARVLGRDMEKAGVKLLWLKSCCLDVAYFNKLVDAAKNKSSVLFDTASILMQDAIDRAGGGVIQIVVDRQGGRMDYAPGLLKMLAPEDLRVLRQDEKDSSYELKMGGKTVKIHFVVEADDRFLPVSLASMVCKYLREMLNECMNAYFLGLYPHLKPTAGYWQDGTRFVEELKAAGCVIDKERFIRIR